MAQQLNLFDKRFAPVALRFSARQGGLVLAGVLAGAWCLAQGLLWAADRAQADAQAVQAGMAPLRAQVGTLAARPDGTAAELARLQAADATQRRVRGRMRPRVSDRRRRGAARAAPCLGGATTVLVSRRCSNGGSTRGAR